MLWRSACDRSRILEMCYHLREVCLQHCFLLNSQCFVLTQITSELFLYGFVLQFSEHQTLPLWGIRKVVINPIDKDDLSRFPDNRALSSKYTVRNEAIILCNWVMQIIHFF